MALGANFSRVRGARSNAYRGPHERCSWGGYRVSASDERQRNREKWPRPFGFHPSTQRPRAGSPGLRRRLGQTALSASTLEPPKPSASALSLTPQTKTCLWGPRSGPIFARNADYPYMWIHPSPSRCAPVPAPGLEQSGPAHARAMRGERHVAGAPWHCPRAWIHAEDVWPSAGPRCASR